MSHSNRKPYTLDISYSPFVVCKIYRDNQLFESFAAETPQANQDIIDLAHRKLAELNGGDSKPMMERIVEG